ncbi:MAG: hypothetical protein ACRD9Q_11640 [Nitrososphaeraceae archaeon]
MKYLILSAIVFATVSAQYVQAAPASSIRIIDSLGNEITPSLNEPAYFQYDVVNAYGYKRTFDIEILVIMDDGKEPILHERQQLKLNPDEVKPISWSFTPRKAGNYESKIIVDGISTTYGFILTSENRYADPILIPFEKSDVVLVGKVIDVKELVTENKSEYSIAVEKYLKNQKPQDLIIAIGDGIAKKEITDFNEVNYYNRPIFDVGNKVFVYLNKENGTFKMSPYSFALYKNETGGPPQTNAWPTAPQKFEFDSDEEITISGLVKKAYLYYAGQRGENTTVYIKIYNPKNELYASEIIETKVDGTFTYPVKIKGRLGIDGLYSYDVGPPNQGWAGGFFVNAKSHPLAPLKQFKSGSSLYDIKCRNDLLLVAKSHGDSPACVKPLSMLRLLETGWGYIPRAFETKTDLLDTEITGGRIVGFKFDVEAASIVINLQTTSDGSLTFTIPKALTSSMSWYQNNPSHGVLIDGQFLELNETITTGGMTVTIPFKEGSKIIEIVGTR